MTKRGHGTATSITIIGSSWAGGPHVDLVWILQGRLWGDVWTCQRNDRARLSRVVGLRMGRVGVGVKNAVSRY